VYHPFLFLSRAAVEHLNYSTFFVFVDVHRTSNDQFQLNSILFINSKKLIDYLQMPQNYDPSNN